MIFFLNNETCVKIINKNEKILIDFVITFTFTILIENVKFAFFA